MGKVPSAKSPMIDMLSMFNIKMLQLQIRSYPLPMVVECGFGAGQVSLLTYYVVVFELY